MRYIKTLALAALLLAVTAVAAHGAPGDVAQAQSSASTDRAALVDLYRATGGDNWTYNTNWLSDRPLGKWHGVATDASGRVTQLTLGDNQLDGMIPSSLGNLSNLTDLGLNGNQLAGEIPSSLGNLSNLERLTLWSNQLTGTIPSSLGNLSNLEWLYLNGNQLAGEIPSSLGNLSNLTDLGLNGNQLAGEIPSSLGNLSNLERLYLAGNQLTGCVPAALRDVEYNDFADLALPFCDTLPAMVTLSSDTISSGENITITGRNFPALATVEVMEIGGVDVRPVPAPQTSTDGDFESTVLVPQLVPATHIVLVQVGRTLVTTSLEIVAAVADTPASYDSNGNGTIELSELFDAIDDYFAGGISLAVLFDIIDLYFSGDSVG